MQQGKRRGIGASAVALAALILLANTAQAQESGDTVHGLALAEQICAECHAIHRDERISPHPQAPSFTSVADKRGMTGTALRVWFQVPHRSMPDLTLSEMDGDDLVAYILSLKTRR
jgi:mono/diheme cytochrome c family protein